MNIKWPCVFCLVLFGSAIFLGSAPLSGDSHAIPTYPFHSGEKLVFVIKYEFIGAGVATLEVKKGPLIEKRPTFQFISEAKSNSFIDVFFKVRDYNSTIVDAQTLTTLSFHQNLKEGHYQVVRNIHLDYAKKTYAYERVYKGQTNTKTGPLEEPVTDVLSSFYLTRSLPLKLGEEYAIRVFSDKHIYSLKVVVDKHTHMIRVPAGRFDCLQIEPFIEGDAIFKLKDGKMQIWLTNDNRRMPVLIRSKVSVGAFDAELEKY